MNEVLYVESADSLKEEITRIDAIIKKLEIQMLNVGAEDSNLEYYILDDGQTKITTAYRDVRLIPQAIQRFKTLRTTLINKLNGRCRILRDVRGCR